MRILGGILLLVSLVAARPQDSLDLRARYGEPSVERFHVLPNVTLTVEYEEGHALLLELEPRHAFLHEMLAPMPSFSRETAHQAIQELLPEALGKGCHSKGTFQSGAHAVVFGSCGNLVVSETSTRGPEGGPKSLVVRSEVGPLSPTSKQLHERYGEPDVEVFAVSSDLMLAAEYGEDRQVCAMRIEVAHSMNSGLLNPTEAAPGQLAATLDDLVPPATRGRNLGPGQLDPASWHDATPPTEYENVRIQPYYGLRDREPKVRGTDVRFKRAICSSLSKRSEK